MLFLHSIDDGRQLWKSDVLNAAMNPGGNALMGLLMSAALSMVAVDPVQSEPLELDDGTFLLGAMGHVMRIEHATGKVLWKTDFAGGTFEFRQIDARPDVVYVGSEEDVQQITSLTGDQTTTQQRTETLYQGFRLADGSAVWRRPVRFQRPMNRSIIALDRGLVVSDGDGDKGKLLLLDYETGESLWGNKGRGIEIAGQVLDYSFAGTNLVLTPATTACGPNTGTEYLLYVLDTVGGKLRFEKPFKVTGRMLGTELTDQGLIYVTTHEINVFDPATGAWHAQRARAAQQGAARDDQRRSARLRVQFRRRLHVPLRPRDGRHREILAGAVRARREGSARALDLVDGTVVLMGQQTVASFAPDGALPSTSIIGATRSGVGARLSLGRGRPCRHGVGVRGDVHAAFASVAGDAEEGSVGREVATELSDGFGDLTEGYAGLAGDYVRFARRRYEASAESRDFFFMMVQHQDRRVTLAQVSKRDGSILGEIDLHRDKEPDYQVDDVSSFVFYRPADSVVAGYRFADERVNVALQ